MPRARKKPKKLQGLKSVVELKQIDGTVDHGVKTHFKIKVEHRTSGDAFVNALGEMRDCDGRLSIDGMTMLRRASQPVPGARAVGANEVRPVEGDVNGRTYVQSVHPLEAMEKKGLISRAECTAGLRISKAWEKTQTSPSKDLSEDRVDTSRTVAGAENGLDAMRSFQNLMRVLPGDARSVCHHVCCTGRFLRDGFSRNNREMAVHVETLRMGLAVVADASSSGIL